MRPLHIALLVGAIALPATASADLLTLWAAGKGDYFDGTGEQIGRYTSAMGVGAEAGMEILFIDLWGEAVFMGSEQMRLSGNIGFDASFGDDSRFTIGLFTGILALYLPPKAAAAGLSLNLSPDDEAQLQTYLQAIGQTLTVDEMKTRFAAEADKYAEQQGELERWAAAWNIARLRITMEQKLLPLLYIGFNADVAFHLMFSGEQVAAAAKDQVVDEYARKNMLPGEAVALIKEAVEAEKVDQDSGKTGLNYGFGLFLKLEL